MDDQSSAAGKIIWTRAAQHPFINPRPETCASESVTTPDILVYKNQTYLYFGGISEGTERILVLPLPQSFSRNKTVTIKLSSVALDVGPNAFDKRHVFDPAPIIWNNNIHLYYSAIGSLEDSIGLARSKDGVHFVKFQQPLLVGRSPAVVTNQDKIYLFYILNESANNYVIWGAISEDGVKFQPISSEPIIKPGKLGSWDSFEVTTPRLFQHLGIYYMLYAGCNDYSLKDLPIGFGLARSFDLLHWKKYPHNPVFHKGLKGHWDDSAIWFGSVFAHQNNLYLLYEGGHIVEEFGQKRIKTQIGLALLPIEEFEQGVSNWQA